MSGEIKRGEFNSEQNQDWTPSSQPEDENQENQTKEKFDSTGEGGEIIEKKEDDQTVVVDDKKNHEEELTPEEIERAKQEKEGIERANREIQEMDNWKKLQEKGLLKEEADGILNKLLEEIIPEIDQKTGMLNMARGQVKRVKERIDKGEFDKSGIPENRNINPTIDLEEREAGMKKLKEDYYQLKERLRILEQIGSLEKKTAPEEEIVEETEEVSGEKEESKKKGFWGSLFGKK